MNARALSRSSSKLAFSPVAGNLLQRKCACGGNKGLDSMCEECRSKRLQRRSSNGVEPTTVPPVVHDVLRSPGQPLDQQTRALFEPRFGHDFSKVRMHNDAKAAESARAVNALAYTSGSDIVFSATQYQPACNSGRSLLAHELTHVIQQTQSSSAKPLSTLPPSRAIAAVNRPGDAFECEADHVARQLVAGTVPEQITRPEISGAAYPIIQRDLALEPPVDVAVQPDLTEVEIQEAIAFNRRSYNEDSIRLIQDVVGAEPTGVLEAETIRFIAVFQEQFGLQKDGKVGDDTFELINQELTAEGAPTENCLTMFRVTGPSSPLDLRVAGPGLADIFSRFDVDIMFSSRCNCSEFEYRQFICGNATRTRGGTTTPQNHLFTNLPTGSLLPCPDWHEDGDTSNVPPRYGHRNQPAGTNPVDRYLDDQGNVNQANGCRYESFDIPGLFSVPVQTGDQFDFDIRFFGDVRRAGHGRVDRRFWAVRDTTTIP